MNKKEKDYFQIIFGSICIFLGLLITIIGIIESSSLSYETNLVMMFHAICFVCFGVIFLELRQ